MQEKKVNQGKQAIIMRTRTLRNCLAIALALQFTTQLSGHTATVTVCDEPALRAALDQGATEILFECNGTVVLTSTILVTNQLTLDATDRLVRLSGGGSNRLFEIQSGGSLTLKSLTLSEGRIQGIPGHPAGHGQGGAVFLTLGTLSASQCRFEANTAQGGDGDWVGTTGGSGFGGAIYGVSSAIFLTNCVFSNNVARGGMGGPDDVGNLNAGPGGYALGGAVGVYYSSVTGVNCRFEGNLSESGISRPNSTPQMGIEAVAARGGALDQIGSSTRFIESAFISNKAFSPFSQNLSAAGGTHIGGAVFVDAGSSDFEDTIFDGNQSVGGNTRRFAQSGVGGGGALANRGDIRMRRCSIANNLTSGGEGGGGASGYGGAIQNEGTLEIFESTFSSNSAAGALGLSFARPVTGEPGYGGAIWNTGICRADSSSFIGNIAIGVDGGWSFNGSWSGADAAGGAVANTGIFMGINLTFAKNIATGGGYPSTDIWGRGGIARGGALFNQFGTTVLSHVTFSSNESVGGRSPSSIDGSNYVFAPSFGGSIFNSNGMVTVHASILGGSFGSSNVFGSLVDAGYNLSSDDSAGFSTLTSRHNVNPQLGSLANNGGRTLTLSPLPGSPAINFGDDSSGPGTDQRGVPRPQGVRADIGAVEATLLTIERLANGNLRLRYGGIPGTNYTLEGTQNYDAPWTSVETKPAAVNGLVEYSDSLPSDARWFFRVKTP